MAIKSSLTLSVLTALMLAPPTVPKVPFGNKPCESITSGDAQGLGMPAKMSAKADRAPATLPIDNFCTWTDGGSQISQVGYMTEIDYQTNESGNKSTSYAAPAGLAGSFWDKQGGLWFAKNGYYVVVSGKKKFREPVAKLVAGKL